MCSPQITNGKCSKHCVYTQNVPPFLGEILPLIKLTVWYTSTHMIRLTPIVSQQLLTRMVCSLLLTSAHVEGDFTVSLNTQRIPFNSDSQQEFDANLGRHDAFLLIGAYIFAQKTNSEGVISLYVSYNRQPFQKAMIPSTDPHQVRHSMIFVEKVNHLPPLSRTTLCHT